VAFARHKTEQPLNALIGHRHTAENNLEVDAEGIAAPAVALRAY